MNKKFISFIFGSILVFSIFGAINFQEVEASYTMNVTVTTQTSNYQHNSFNTENMPVRFRFQFTPTGVSTTNRWTEVRITAPAGYILAATGSQPSPTGFARNFDDSTANGSDDNEMIVYDSDITTTTTRTIEVDIVGTPPPDGSESWTITTTVGGDTKTFNPITIADNDPPTFRVIYEKSPKVLAQELDDVPPILGLGTVTIRVVSDKPLAERPTIGVQQVGRSLSSVTATGTAPGTVFTRTYTIASTNGQSDGPAQVTVSGKDRAGNIGTEIISNISISSPLNDGPIFTVDSVCDRPSLVSPAQGASQTSTTANFSWDAPSDDAIPLTYVLQYSTGSNFPTGTSTRTVSGTTYDATGLTPGTWYWRVKAIDALGNDSGYTSTRNFTITSDDTEPPTFRVRYVKPSKIDYDTSPDVLGAGQVQIMIYSSKTLEARPTVQIRLHNQTSWSNLTVTGNAPGTNFTATYNIPTSSTYNGLAQITVSGRDMSGNVGNTINASRWDASRGPPNYLPSTLDSDGPTFYVDTATDAPSVLSPQVPAFGNEVTFRFNKISDISAERPADPGQDNCITYHLQYSTSADFSTNVITQSVDVNESIPNPVFCADGSTSYNRWTISGNLRTHKSQALSNGTWYWRAWATDKLGNQSPYSETKQFAISTSRPTLVSPTDLSLLASNTPVLRWKGPAEATSYNIRLSRGDNVFLNYTSYPDKIAVNSYTNVTPGDPNTIHKYNVSVSTPPTPPIGQLEDGVWYWAVSSNIDSQVYSATWRFIVDTTGPPAPQLLTLADGQVSQNKRPQFTWSAVSDVDNLSNPVRYFIQISGNSSFPDNPSTTWPSTTSFDDWKNVTYIRGPLTSTQFTPIQDFPETLLTAPGNVYYWRVYAVDSAGNKGTNSITRNFRVSTSPPLLWGDQPAGENGQCEVWPTGCIPVDPENRDQLALGLRSPSNGFTLNTRTPSLEWRHSRCECVVKEISSYIIQYSRDITFPTDKTKEVAGVFQVLGINPDNINLINMGYTIQTPMENGTYFWRVAAVDTAGNRTQFTPPWSFTVFSPDPLPPDDPDVPVYSPGNLTITVVDPDDNPIEGATVTVNNNERTTDNQGRAVYTNLPGGVKTINNVTATGFTAHGTGSVTVDGNTTRTITLVPPDQEGYIHGFVQFDDGSPAANVTVNIFNQETNVNVDSRLTNSEGRFQSAPLQLDRTFFLRIAQYDVERRDLSPRSLDDDPLTIVLPAKGTATGMVVDEEGRIVAGATVVLRTHPGGTFVESRTTSSIGQFSFEAAPGSYTIDATRTGYEPYSSPSFTIRSAESINLPNVIGDIVLRTITGTLSATVRDGGGDPIGGARVTVRSEAGTVVRTITTDSSGVATTSLAPARYRVSAVADGFAESTQQTVTITSNQTSSVSITLAPATGSIRVVATDPAGNPLIGAEVFVDGVLSGVTDEQGELLVTGLTVGTHRVRITKGGYTAVEEQVTSGPTTVVIETPLRRNYLPYYLLGGFLLVAIAAGVYYFRFYDKKGPMPKRPPAPKGPSLPGRPATPKLRPHRHKGGLPPSSIKVKKKNL